MREKFGAKGKKLYFGFVGLEKAFDRVLREVIRWAMRRLGVEEWLVLAVMSIYTGAKTVVRSAYGNSNGFKVCLLHSTQSNSYNTRHHLPFFLGNGPTVVQG